jgi:hypothetical protein
MDTLGREGAQARREHGDRLGGWTFALLFGAAYLPLRREENETLGAKEDERIMLRRLETGLPDDLDALTPPQRRELYKKLGLTVLANGDGSLTLSWMVDLELGVIRCREERT